MNIRRTTSLILTAFTRAKHRHGFGIQSPWAYELVRDVLYERLPYYAYAEQGLATPLEQQLFRIRNHYRKQPIVIIDEKDAAASRRYDEVMQSSVTPDTILIIEHTHDSNARLWQTVVDDPRAVITFDMGRRGMVVFDPKRIKQNYLL